MYTSIAVVLLLGAVQVPGNVNEPTWLNDYSQARKQAESTRKPLAVFIGAGEAGYRKVARNGTLPPEAKSQLASNYTCVYIDLETPEGRQLAERFAISQATGLVISDRTGSYQAFHYRGTLTDDELARNLKRFSAADYIVRSTITDPSQERVSYYPGRSNPGSGVSSPAFYPNYSSYSPALFGGFSQSC